MNINEILSGSIIWPSVEDQKEILEQMKEKSFFDLKDIEIVNLINFLCEKTETNLAIDYLFHVLDTEVPYPIDDEKVKKLFQDDRMKKMKTLMLEQLNTIEEDKEKSDNDEQN